MSVRFLNPLSKALLFVNAARSAEGLLDLKLATRRPTRTPVYRVAGPRRSERTRVLEQHDRALGRTVILDCSSEGHPTSNPELKALAEKSAGLRFSLS